MSLSELPESVWLQLERIRDNAAYSAQTQFEAAKRLDRESQWLGVVSTVGATAGGFGLLSHPSPFWSVPAIIAACASFIVAIRDPSARAKQSEMLAHEYTRLRNRIDAYPMVEEMEVGDREALSVFLAEEARLNCQIALARDNDFEKADQRIRRSRN